MDSIEHKEHVVIVVPPQAFTAGVTNLRSTRLCYTARGHICKLYIYYEKLHNSLEG
jgi:hypothetical protein